MRQMKIVLAAAVAMFATFAVFAAGKATLRDSGGTVTQTAQTDPAKATFRNSEGRVVMTSQTSGNKTTYRNAEGKVAGTAQKDQSGRITYRDAGAKVTGTAQKDQSGRTTYRSADGKVLLDAGEFEIPSNGKLALGQVPFSGQGVVLIVATLDGRPYKNHFLYGEPPFDWTKMRELVPAIPR